MANAAVHNNLFSSLISDIKTYTGKDPLLPWLRGIRKMIDSLPPQLLKEKLPRFLQKCAQTFETDRRYTNDLRYLRVWLKLMDFVDDPGVVLVLLETMKANHIGNKRSLFYQAYALYYEKMKKFKEAEKMYHLGVQNLAEPIDELQKSFEQFLHRMKRHKNKRIQRRSIPNCDDTKGKSEDITVKGRPMGSLLKENIPETQFKSQKLEENKVLAQNPENEMPMKEVLGEIGHESGFKQQDRIEAQSDDPGEVSSDDTVVVKFADTAIVGKSKAEAASHHGLVEPTINTKEAMDVINSMFREPLGPEIFSKGSRRSKPNADQSLKNGFEVFIDDNLDSRVDSSSQNQPLQVPFQICIDDEESNEMKEGIQEKDNYEDKKAQKTTDGAFVFQSPKDLPLKCSESPPQARFREDTVVFRFVGSTISDEPEVENVCHHGLVEPTINLKEAMEDINGMFGKPIEFTRKKRPKKQDKPLDRKRNCGSFLILPDDDLDYQLGGKCQPCSSSGNDSDLFEQTVCTKEAMDEINKMFGMPLDF